MSALLSIERIDGGCRHQAASDRSGGSNLDGCKSRFDAKMLKVAERAGCTGGRIVSVERAKDEYAEPEQNDGKKSRHYGAHQDCSTLGVSAAGEHSLRFAIHLPVNHITGSENLSISPAQKLLR